MLAIVNPWSVVCAVMADCAVPPVVTVPEQSVAVTLTALALARIAARVVCVAAPPSVPRLTIGVEVKAGSVPLIVVATLPAAV